MRCDEPRFGCFGCVLACVVWFGGFEDGHDAIWIDGDGCFANTILRMDDELKRGYYLIRTLACQMETHVWLAVGWDEGLVDIV